jgi:hypothetical protein
VDPVAMSYFLAKKLKGIANKMGFRTRLAPPSDALPAISDAVANTAVARDVLVSRADSRRVVIKDIITPGPALTVDALERFQCAGMKHFEQMGIMSIVADERMPRRAMATRSLFIDALNDTATFHIENCVRMAGESVDWADFMQMPIAFIGPVMLLKGDNPRLDALRNVIYRFRRIQSLVKASMHEPDLSEEANRKIFNDVLREPMQELAAFAGYKYGQLLFVSPPGELWNTGICKPRYQELMKWLDAIEKRVERSIKEFKKEMELMMKDMELMELRRRVASLEAMLMAQ